MVPARPARHAPILPMAHGVATKFWGSCQGRDPAFDKALPVSPTQDQAINPPERADGPDAPLQASHPVDSTVPPWPPLALRTLRQPKSWGPGAPLGPLPPAGSQIRPLARRPLEGPALQLAAPADLAISIASAYSSSNSSARRRIPKWASRRSRPSSPIRRARSGSFKSSAMRPA